MYNIRGNLWWDECCYCPVVSMRRFPIVFYFTVFYTINDTCIIIVASFFCRKCNLIRQPRNQRCRMMMWRITSLLRVSWSSCLSFSLRNTWVDERETFQHMHYSLCDFYVFLWLYVKHEIRNVFLVSDSALWFNVLPRAKKKDVYLKRHFDVHKISACHVICWMF